MKKLFKEYTIEIIALVIALGGIFLLVEQFEIRAALRENLAKSSGWLAGLVRSILDGISGFVSNLTLSDLTGLILILAAAAFLVWRTRYHFLRSERWRAANCPRCGSKLHRIHRTTLDRLLAFTLLPKGRRYICANPECGWKGLCAAAPGVLSPRRNFLTRPPESCTTA